MGIDEPNRYCIQLYRRVAGAGRRRSDCTDDRVLVVLVGHACSVMLLVAELHLPRAEVYTLQARAVSGYIGLFCLLWRCIARRLDRVPV